MSIILHVLLHLDNKTVCYIICIATTILFSNLTETESVYVVVYFGALLQVTLLINTKGDIIVLNKLSYL